MVVNYKDVMVVTLNKHTMHHEMDRACKLTGIKRIRFVILSGLYKPKLNRHVSWWSFLSRKLFMLIYMHYTKMKLSYNEFIIMW